MVPQGAAVRDAGVYDGSEALPRNPPKRNRKMTDDSFDEELEYLYQYARKGLLYFTPLWDSAETLAGEGAPSTQVREVALGLIGALMDRGVRVGDISQRANREIEPWDEAKSVILDRISEGIKRRKDPPEFMDICGFRA